MNRWIVIIVALLATNVLAQIALALFATNGDTQVIPAYYDRALHYDDAIDQAARDRVLGWHLDTATPRGVLDVGLHDAAGKPISDAEIHVRGYARANAAVPIDLVLVARSDGRYRAGTALRAGWHDFVITVDRRGDLFVRNVAIEAK
jgi:nitrogen fixation protein FixH